MSWRLLRVLQGSGGVSVGAGGVQPRGAIAISALAAGAVVSVAALEAGSSSPAGAVVWQAVRRRRVNATESFNRNCIKLNWRFFKKGGKTLFESVRLAGHSYDFFSQDVNVLIRCKKVTSLLNYWLNVIVEELEQTFVFREVGYVHMCVVVTDGNYPIESFSLKGGF